MKKILSLCVAAVAAITMTAQDIAVNIKLTAQSGGESTLLLASGTGVSSADNATLVAPLSNSDNVAIYVQDDQRYSIFATDGSFANQPFAIITDRMGADKQTYTLHFEDVLAGYGTGALTLKDLVTGDEFTIVDGGTYDFVVNTTNAANYVAGTNTIIADRFVINYNPALFVASVTTNEDGWASFTDQVAGRNVAPVYPAGLKVYKGKVNGTDPNNIVFDLSQVNAIYWGEGVFVKGAPLTTYYFAEATADMDDFVDNEIIGCAEAKPVEDIRIGGQYEIYALRHEGDSPTALYQYVGTDDIPAGKAVMRIHWDDYLIVPGSPAPRRITVRVNETEETQAIENVELAAPAEKFIENGEVLIRRGEAVYNLQGQMVR